MGKGLAAFLGGVLLLAGGASAQGLSTRAYALPEGAGPHDVAPAPDGSVW